MEEPTVDRENQVSPVGDGHPFPGRIPAASLVREDGLRAIIDSLRIVQKDARTAAVPTHEELREIITAYGAALDMSDSEHPDFRDSNADVVEYLWFFESPVRQALSELASRHDPAS